MLNNNYNLYLIIKYFNNKDIWKIAKPNGNKYFLLSSPNIINLFSINLNYLLFGFFYIF